MTFKPVSTLVSLAVLAFAVAYFGSPVLAARQLTEAAETGNEAELNRLVDFPAFRASLKDELKDAMMTRLRLDSPLGDSALAGLGMVLAPGLLNGAVDVLITPEVVAEVVRSGEAPDPTRGLRRRAEPAPEAGAEAGTKAGEPDNDLHQAWGYRDLDNFGITLTRKAEPDQALTLLLERQGLFGWKLSAVDLNPGV